MMAFDGELARKILRRGDRDSAPFFAGREFEIGRFDDALAELDDFDQFSTQAVFRIYQGAPGCGKTSLIRHLRKIRSTDIGLFVDIQLEELRSISALSERVRRVAEDQAPARIKAGAKFLQALASSLRMEGSGTELRNIMTDRTAKRTKIVLHMDEAQVVEPSAQPGLLMLHTRGLGVPCACVLTGLSNTADRLSNIDGLSRLSTDVVVNMGAMSLEECAESARMMLDECGVIGCDADKERAAMSVAELSHGWPQHLHGAQTALCGELLRTDGSLDAVDWERVRSESDRSRHEYYHRRLFNTVLDMVPEATAQIVAKVRQQHPRRLFDLEGLCEAEMARMGLDKEPMFRATPEKFATALVERGVLAIAPAGWYDVAIPSMGEWIGTGFDSIRVNGPGARVA